MRSVKHALFGTLGTAVAVTGLSALAADPARANPAGTGLVISEVYGGGGNSGGAYRSDFIELFNPTGAAIPLGGLSLHYRSASGGSAGSPVALSGSVAAGRHFLVKAADGSNAAQPALPAPDASVAFNMSGTGGQVFLLDGATPFIGSGDVAGNDSIVDMIGWGSATTFERAPGPGTANATAVARTGSAADTDDNSADLTTGAPTPQAAAGGSADPDPGPEPTGPVTIAEVQGTGSTSPLAGSTVTTRGVVTATYPTGGFNGFYVQTPGPDTTPGASDGLFVYGPTFDESTLAIGDSVSVTGQVSEFNGLTEVTATSVEEVPSLGAVVPNAGIPGTDCALPGTECLTGADLDAAREEMEGEAFRPTGAFTVTDAYDGSAYNPPSSRSSNFFGEIGLAANSTDPLITPTEVVDAQDAAGIAARVAYNNAHRVVLDDGSTTTYWNTSNTGRMDQPLPWFTADHQVRVGAAVTFDQPVILDYRFGWKVQPVRQVTGEPSGLVTFEQDRPAAPAEVGGDVRLATFNVLNYFTTLGADYEGCTSHSDREGDPIAVNRCPGNGPRGAWDETSFARQQAKIVTAINALEADVVSVEEIENSIVVDGHDRDEALGALVDALNAAAGADTWDYVRSPAAASETANVAEQDVIRNGFIYKPASVQPAGEADMLFGEPAFANAREPFAAVFQPAGGDPARRFAVIVNHFKSKGSGVNDGTGQGNANPDRVAQATALASYAADFAAERDVPAVFLTGDFNAYSREDPMQVLDGAGFTALEAHGKHTYSFDGQSGSLDHVLANDAALALVTGVDIWEVNANETVFNQYSRYNYNTTILYDESPFSASDHNPEVVGLDVAGIGPEDIQILATNDFHGRIANDPFSSAAGAAAMAGAVKQLREDNPNT
ncbi:MAG TPA: ExeM/NucH family extracellular endonuclease, partial [Acidimicrobiales bacterium]